MLINGLKALVIIVASGYLIFKLWKEICVVKRYHINVDNVIGIDVRRDSDIGGMDPNDYYYMTIRNSTTQAKRKIEITTFMRPLYCYHLVDSNKKYLVITNCLLGYYILEYDSLNIVVPMDWHDDTYIRNQDTVAKYYPGITKQIPQRPCN